VRNLPPVRRRPSVPARASLVAIAALAAALGISEPASSRTPSAPAVVPATPGGQIPLTVRTAAGAAIRERVEGLGGRVEYVFENVDAVAVTLPQGAIDELLNDPRVESADRQRYVRTAVVAPEFPNARGRRPLVRLEGDLIVPLPGGPIDTRVRPVSLSELAATARGTAPSSFLGYDVITGAAQSWEAAGFGEGVIVAVIDTGIFPGHPLLDGNVIGGFNLVPEDEEGALDFDGDGVPDGVAFDWDAVENNGHGTFVSGMIAGHADLTMPVDSPLAASVAYHSPETVTVDGDMATLRLVGAAPGASLYGVKVFPYDGGSAPDARVAEAIDRLVSMKRHGTLDVDVINMSLSGPVLFDGWNPLDLVVNVATLHGITVVSAASNTGPAMTSVGSPASAFTGLAVGGAVDPLHTRIAFEVFFGADPGLGDIVYPHDVQIVGFAARGLTADRRAKPDLIATAFLLFSSSLVDLDGNGLNDTPFFGFSSGTSFSAPTVSGCAALVTAFAQRNGRIARAPFIANALRKAAEPIGELPEVSPREQGRGFVDVARAIELVSHGNVWDPSWPDKRHTRQKHFDLRHSVSAQAHDVGPGESFQFLLDVPPGISNIRFEFPEVELGTTQNPVFGDAAEVTIHSAQRGGAGDYVAAFGAIEPGDSFDYEWPEPGTMRVTLAGALSNYGDVGVRFTADADHDELAVNHHVEGALRRDEVETHEIEVPAGLHALAVRLAWKHDWTRYPTYDLDLYIDSPDGVVPAATIDSPELAWIENPTPGTWTFVIQDLGTVLHREPYELDLAFVRSRYTHEVVLDDTPPARVQVTGATPNPMTTSTTFSFALPADAVSVDLAVFDVAGRRVRQLVNGAVPAGSHDVSWDGRSDAGSRAAAGVYFVKLETSSGASTRKVLLMN